MSTSSSSSQNKITGYCSHPQHKLVPAENYEILQTCKDCKARIFGLGSCYNDCEGYFHGACLNAKPNSPKEHPFIPKFHLKYSTEKIKKLYCDACCGYIEGIMYTGSHANKNYSLHPQCLELSPNLGRAFECKGMNSKLEWEPFPKMPTDMKCVFCEMKNGDGWCYGIKSNGESKFACHVRCLKEQLVKDYLNERFPVKMADRKQYFERLYRKNLEKFTNTIVGLASEVVAVGLDLMISSFVGAPFASIISAGIGVIVHRLSGKKL